MSVDFPGKYNSWDRVEPSELFTCPTEKKEASPGMKMEAYLASEAKNCSILVLWLDCDKEGENICFEVINAVRSSMLAPSRGDFMDNVYRARFSAISEKEIKQAMAQLARPNLNESLSVDARQELDLRIGCSFTRFQTRYFQDKYGDLDSTCISFGPCQTPTLAFCVNRHDQIVQFKPEPYWVLAVEVESSGGGGRGVRLEHERERIFDKEVAQLFLARVKKADTARVVGVSSKEGRKEKPMALHTVELLKVGAAVKFRNTSRLIKLKFQVASSSLGLSPTQCMSCAEHLYTRGFISYPRTETSSYPKDFDFHSILRQLASAGGPRHSQVATQILQTDGIVQPKHGEDKGDHPPITPMAPGAGLSGDHARIYDYVVSHFLATLMRPCRYLTRTVSLEVGGEAFSVQSRQVVDPGFTSVMTWQAVSEEECLEGMREGATLPVREAKLQEKETSPPGYLTESELISQMEKYGIGTDASIPVSLRLNDI